MKVLGDLHGDYQRLERILRMNPGEKFVVAGDMGIGFNQAIDYNLRRILENFPNLRFIRGNHDDPAKCREMPGYIEDGTLENGILYIGGAWSIDGPGGFFRPSRTIGIDWWEDEELSHSEWEALMEKLEGEKIHTVVSHDGPSEFISNHVHLDRYISTRTGDSLQALWQAHPEIETWVMGHHHQNVNARIRGTNFWILADVGTAYPL